MHTSVRTLRERKCLSPKETEACPSLLSLQLHHRAGGPGGSLRSFLGQRREFRERSIAHPDLSRGRSSHGPLDLCTFT